MKREISGLTDKCQHGLAFHSNDQTGFPWFWQFIFPLAKVTRGRCTITPGTIPGVLELIESMKCPLPDHEIYLPPGQRAAQKERKSTRRVFENAPSIRELLELGSSEFDSGCVSEVQLPTSETDSGRHPRDESPGPLRGLVSHRPVRSLWRRLHSSDSYCKGADSRPARADPF